MFSPIVDLHTLHLSADHIPAGPSDHTLAVSVCHILTLAENIQAMTVDHILAGFLDHILALSSVLLLYWTLRNNHLHWWLTVADQLLGHSTSMNHLLGLPYRKTHLQAVLGIRIQAAYMTAADGFLPEPDTLRSALEYIRGHYRPLPWLWPDIRAALEHTLSLKGMQVLMNKVHSEQLPFLKRTQMKTNIALLAMVHGWN